jgi:hypothetical protein
MFSNAFQRFYHCFLVGRLYWVGDATGRSFVVYLLKYFIGYIDEKTGCEKSKSSGVQS